MLTTAHINIPLEPWLASVGTIFARFDTQDSGNASWGVAVGGRRFFVKTAGHPADTAPMLDHASRVALLRSAVTLQRATAHPALLRTEAVIETPHGPALVYPWFDGDLLYDPVHRARFAALSPARRTAAVATIFGLHAELATLGWVAVDLYDGCFLYDFDRHILRVMDLDMYRPRPFINRMGRMFGSSRFMAPEEHTRGARIDLRTTAFNLGRTAAVLMAGGSLERAAFVGTDAQHALMLRALSRSRSRSFFAAARLPGTGGLQAPDGLVIGEPASIVASPQQEGPVAMIHAMWAAFTPER